MHNISYANKPCRPFVLLFCFLMASLIYTNSFADSLYKVQAGDFLGKIVSKNYPSSQRVNSKEQIMIAILRANPEAFRGGNVHFLKKVDQLILPTESTIALISKDEALKTVKKHYNFFKKRKTGNFPLIPLQRPTTEKVKKVISTKKSKVTKKTQKEIVNEIAHELTANKNKKILGEKKENRPPPQLPTTNKTTIIKSVSSDIKTSDDKRELVKKEKNIFPSPFENKKKDKAIKKDKLSYKNSPHAEDANKNTAKKSRKLTSIKNKKQKESQITLYFWDNFIPKDVLTSFTKETGIKVNTSIYKKDEAMYEKIKALNGRGYDILITTGRFVQKIRDKGLLQAIDHRKLKNFKNINPTLLNKPYDPNNEFSIPYIWGSTGIGIDTNKVDSKNITHWKNLWHKQWRNKLLLHDNMRDLFAIALKINGHSINSRNPDEIKQAYRTLRKLIPNIKQLANKNKLPDQFISSKGSIATFWSSRASKLKKRLPSLQYIYPQEGAFFWVDSLMIPSNASNIENVYTFIDYLLRLDIADRCANALGESTPNLKAMENIISQGTTINFPDTEALKKGEFEESIGKAEVLYQLYWRKLKREITQNNLSNNPH